MLAKGFLGVVGVRLALFVQNESRLQAAEHTHMILQSAECRQGARHCFTV